MNQKTQHIDLDWRKIITASLILLILTTAVYAIKLPHYGYLEDDWNTLFVGNEIGFIKIIKHYASDRPIRGFYQAFTYYLFRNNMLVWQAFGIFMRFVGAWAFYFTLNLIWRKRYTEHFLITAVVLLYPGFLEQPHAFDYQAQFMSMTSALTSIALSMLVLYLPGKFWRYLLILPAVLLAVISYGIMEYYVSFEALRLLLLGVCFFQRKANWKIAVLNALPYLVTTLAFVVWRVFIFESGRTSVDSSTMIDQYRASFFSAISADLIKAVENTYRVLIGAWYQPITRYLKAIQGADWLLAAGLLFAAGGLLWLGIRQSTTDQPPDKKPQTADRTFAVQLTIIGLLAAGASILPIIFGGRHVNFTDWNRFSYPGSIGAAVFLIGLIRLIPHRFSRQIILVALILSAVLVQFANDILFEQNYFATRDTWWQLSWRAPAVKFDTFVVADMPEVMLSEAYTLWAPLNLIYFPGYKPEALSVDWTYHQTAIGAEVWNEETLANFQNEATDLEIRRNIAVLNKYYYGLIFSKPTTDSCLHVIDGRFPEISIHDSDRIREIMPYSHIDRIVTESDKDLYLDPQLFGSEPEQDWCYYYQLVSLERQRGDWEAAGNLAREAIEQGYSARDAVEWMPFVQALAYTQQADLLAAAQAPLLAEPFLKTQACQIFSDYESILETPTLIERNHSLTAVFCEK